MPFVLKKNDDNEEISQPKIFAGTIKIGSSSQCDLVIESSAVLPFHAEIYHRPPEYRLAPNRSADIKVNDNEILKWPAVLNDGDIITFGDASYRFSIIQQVIGRNWKAGFSAYLALVLLILLILFELGVMLCLPYLLHRNRVFDTAASKQYILRQIDELRVTTKGLTTYHNDNIAKIKSLLTDCEDDTANYLRKYIDYIDDDQILTIRKNLSTLNMVVTEWPTSENNYLIQEQINPESYLVKLNKNLQEKFGNKYKNNEEQTKE